MKKFGEIIPKLKAEFIPNCHIATKSYADEIDACLLPELRELELRNSNLDAINDLLYQCRGQVARRLQQTRYGGNLESAAIAGDEAELVYASTAFITELISWITERIEILEGTIDAIHEDERELVGDTPVDILSLLGKVVQDESRKFIEDLMGQECDLGN